jgi:hypothetical protein
MMRIMKLAPANQVFEEGSNRFDTKALFSISAS